MNVSGYISIKKFKVPFIGLGFVISIIIGFIDYIISPEISFSIFYLIPVLIITWFIGRYPGVLMAVVCSLLWLLAELKHGLVYSDMLIPYWNAVVRLGFFLIVAFLADNVKSQKVSIPQKVMLGRCPLYDYQIVFRTVMTWEPVGYGGLVCPSPTGLKNCPISACLIV